MPSPQLCHSLAHRYVTLSSPRKARCSFTLNRAASSALSGGLQVGWKKDFVDNSVPFLPISGWIGDNLIKKSDNMSWWAPVDVKSQSGKSSKARRSSSPFAAAGQWLCAGPDKSS